MFLPTRRHSHGGSFACGFWLANLHNGLLGLAFTFVGAYVLFQRPGHREGRLFIVTGAGS